MTGRLGSLKRRLLWRYAKWRGGRPSCEQCGNPATWYVSDVGYTCMMCEGQRKSGLQVGFIRDLEPEDHLDN